MTQRTISTDLFGEVAYTPQEVYHFENGMPGFPNPQDFVFIEIEESPFVVMHAVNENLSFFVMNPFTLFTDYEFTIPDSLLEQLNITDEEQVRCYVVIVLRDPLNESTANMIAPIILNEENQKGAQLVLENANYAIRQPIICCNTCHDEPNHLDEVAASQ